MMERPDYLTACVAGLEVAIFGAGHAGAPVIFVGHGRGGAMVNVFDRCRDLARHGYVAFAWDQRNHGRRLVDIRCNAGWSPNHPADIYGALVGAAADVATIIDLAPARLGLPMDRVGMTGFSLGGHATLLAMAADRRIQVGVSVIGGGDFRRLMELRAKVNQTPRRDLPKFYPAALEKVVRRHDPIRHARAFADRPLLLLNGEADPLVQIECARRFEAAARPHYRHGERLVLRSFPGVGHETTPAMWRQAQAWFRKWLPVRKGKKSESPAEAQRRRGMIHDSHAS